jgi:hypothetical protein
VFLSFLTESELLYQKENTPSRGECRRSLSESPFLYSPVKRNPSLRCFSFYYKGNICPPCKNKDMHINKEKNKIPQNPHFHPPARFTAHISANTLPGVFFFRWF